MNIADCIFNAVIKPSDNVWNTICVVISIFKNAAYLNINVALQMPEVKLQDWSAGELEMTFFFH